MNIAVRISNIAKYGMFS